MNGRVDLGDLRNELRTARSEYADLEGFRVSLEERVEALERLLRAALMIFQAPGNLCDRFHEWEAWVAEVREVLR